MAGTAEPTSAGALHLLRTHGQRGCGRAVQRSTLAPDHCQGFGTALALRPLRDARAQGHRAAILQAAPDGVGVYERVEFQPFGNIPEYKPTNTAAEVEWPDIANRV